MHRFWQFLALSMLVQIAPASVCCLLPAAYGAEDMCCTPDNAPLPDRPAQPANCSTDSIAHSQLPAALTTPVISMVELSGLALTLMNLHHHASQQSEESILFMPNAPPELLASWLFVSRAALPTRWPSDLA